MVQSLTGIVFVGNPHVEHFNGFFLSLSLSSSKHPDVCSNWHFPWIGFINYETETIRFVGGL